MLRHVATDDCKLKAIRAVVGEIEMLGNWKTSFIEPNTAFVVIEPCAKRGRRLTYVLCIGAKGSHDKVSKMGSIAGEGTWPKDVTRGA